ncbi:MerR family transcriptional regulator [Anaeromicropila herbilytica]|uniref:MerR family transcriptional regulator n=1 Tax=Anaeromicropila herbilytica TaxID=2785025 RepID=A0A7R7IE52_9FIRM|nr:MerR family transcriptional regulator [Anaeromicropila herbilytica]BCN31626.1 MerR family transcriptional regulator [Anaeromicropila herbilytica]
MKINEVAKLSGVTVRTLHYYDEIGLLKPNETTESGYRLYTKESLETLQQILFFREMNFPLSQIKEIMTNPNYDKEQALNKHKELLLKKRDRIDKLITLVNHTIEGEVDMSFKEFDMTEIEKAKNQYATEVKERWGHTEAYAESEKKTKNYDKEQWSQLNEEGASILKRFGENRHSRPDSDSSRELVQQWKEYITDNFYTCTNEILSGLGLMYIHDERFKKNIDKYGEGTAEYMAKSIEVFCDN